MNNTEFAIWWDGLEVGDIVYSKDYSNLVVVGKITVKSSKPYHLKVQWFDIPHIEEWNHNEVKLLANKQYQVFLAKEMSKDFLKSCHNVLKRQNRAFYAWWDSLGVGEDFFYNSKRGFDFDAKLKEIGRNYLVFQLSNGFKLKLWKYKLRGEFYWRHPYLRRKLEMSENDISFYESCVEEDRKKFKK